MDIDKNDRGIFIGKINYFPGGKSVFLKLKTFYKHLLEQEDEWKVAVNIS